MWKIDEAKMWSLGVFAPGVPVRTDSPSLWLFQGLMENWLRQRLSMFAGLEVRSPSHKWSVLYRHLGLIMDDDGGGDVRDWHQDGTDSGERYLGIWSNVVPTDVKVAGSKQGTIYRAKPGEFLLIDNQFFVHREPSEISLVEAKSRWFARLSTGGPVKQHRSVRECTL